MLIGKQDGVNHSVSALGRFDGALQRLFAAPVISVGKNDERLAALLLFHEFIRGQKDGVVKQSTGASVHLGLAIARRLRVGGLRVGRSTAGALKLRRIEQL
jgi:hypothetical protein